MKDNSIPTIEQFPDLAREKLSEYLAQRRPEVAEIGEPVVNATNFLESFVLDGGKRIRPTYAWAGFLGARGLESGEDAQAMATAASSLEFIQACALIHDDIIDASDTRRGNPTVHRAVAAQHRAKGYHGDADFFGQSVAILVGDLALAWAEDMLQGSGLSGAALQRARGPWAGMRTEVIGGQILDISLEAAGSEDPALANTVNRYKTAAYTIERPLHLGAAVAGAEPALIDAFRGYGRDIGIAFQLRDDQLGVFGDPAITGKPAGDDLREGKRTVLLSLALQHTDAKDPAAAKTLRSLIGNTEDPADIARMAQIIEDSGAPALLEEQITALTESGLRHLHEAQVDADVTQTLEALAIKATARRM
ncbi:polyprenyl synthetase family protein [Corynebacterium striatum]|uniref:polyprenyl synthetase family protein n=1 Tax=Corynebacterium striatum TaxID=43770 RepID=UPI001419A1A3|nr:polyprenyl synthetase family protein [Corynebacterium striatum]MCG7249322.1 polyprenyl synthetase family protein [Corynebacterium striatum]NHY11633.1 polyprenyl synthetase family protein [Corynebacterium striatum]NHY36305.1 polyprenyl synthetase family protein [Corynebacterium striatum]HAT1132510.1 polyprenyl synthetase family protein [Corynebacterium striatum]HAT1139203.1 polyprenyl synthetase family protein [Corynebacterium striatum]